MRAALRLPALAAEVYAPRAMPMAAEPAMRAAFHVPHANFGNRALLQAVEAPVVARAPRIDPEIQRAMREAMRPVPVMPFLAAQTWAGPPVPGSSLMSAIMREAAAPPAGRGGGMPEMKDERDVAMFLTGAKNDKELVSEKFQLKNMDPKAIAARVDALVERIDGLKAAGKLPAELEGMAADLEKGKLNIQLSPSGTDHCYLNISRTKVSPEQAVQIAEGAKHPQAVFAAAIPGGGGVATPTGRDNSEAVLELGPGGRDKVVSREYERDGGTVLHNKTTKQHAMVGSIGYGTDVNTKTNTVTQVIVGMGEDHSHDTGALNLHSQESLFGALQRRALPVMAEVGKAHQEGREVSHEDLRAKADTVKLSLAEKFTEFTMRGSLPWQAMTNALAGERTPMLSAAAIIAAAKDPALQDVELMHSRSPSRVVSVLEQATPDGPGMGIPAPARGAAPPAPGPGDVPGVDPRKAAEVLIAASPHGRDAIAHAKGKGGPGIGE